MEAAQPSFAQFLRTMRADDGSDAQMPLFLMALWVWQKVVGNGEWALRAINLLWFVPGLYFFANGRVERLLVASASAFVWYYLDEARPYGMQLGASLLVFALIERAVMAGSAQSTDVPLLQPYEAWLLALGLIVLAGSSLLGAVWAGAAIAGMGLAVAWHSSRLKATQATWPATILFLVLAVLAAYYGWTLIQGARGTAIAETSARNLLFAIYELLGLAGLGPGRTDLRTGQLATFAPYLTPLAVASACMGAVIAAGAVHIWHTVDRRILLACIVVLGGATILIMAAGYLAHWRVVGRHLTPLLPPILAVQAIGLAVLWQRSAGKMIGRGIPRAGPCFGG